MKKALLSVAAVLSMIMAIGQTTDLGTPVTWNGKMKAQKDVPVQTMPAFDVDAMLAADAINMANKVGPYRFGYEHATSLNMDNAGMWESTLRGDKVWRLAVTCPGAFSVNVIFNDFYLPEGAKLHVYNSDHTDLQGAYTSDNNNDNNMLGTDIVAGETMIIEYFEPQAVEGQGRLNVGTVVHAYKDITGGWYGEKVNESGGCNMDVVCPDGVPWDLQIRSVARILNGGGLCTGTLMNNTNNDGTPYFLTADHCGPASMGGAVFRFKYESPYCGSQSSANSGDPGSGVYYHINGSTFRASNSASDFGLIELNSAPSLSDSAVWAGWDNSGAIKNSVVGIHHPSGDVKKLAFDDDPIEITSYLGNSSPGDNTHWRIEAWERNTTTEGGSSGSAIFDPNGRVIGQLHGGYASCSSNTADWYGRLSVSWNGSNSSSRLRDWLDPSNSSTTLDPYDPNASTVPDNAGIQSIVSPTGTICGSNFIPEVVLRNYGSNTLISCIITYDVDGSGAQTYNWSGSLASGATTNIVLPAMTASNGAHTFNASTSMPNSTADTDPTNDASASSFTMVTNGQLIDLSLTLDCWGSEITWEVEDASNNVLYSGGPYSDNTPGGAGTINDQFCLEQGCYDFIISDTYGDGMHGSQYGSCNVDGDYTITDAGSNVLAQMLATNADFGNSETNNFCVGSQPLTADFSANQTTVCDGDDIDFTDLSTGGATGWTWTFNGASPASSTSQNPTNINYATPGTYDVTLVVTDGSGNDTETKVGYITVDDCSDIDEWSGDNITVFPNPSNGAISLRVDKRISDVTIQVLDATGKLVFAENGQELLSGSNHEINLNVSPGAYFIRLTAAEGSMVKKILIK